MATFLSLPRELRDMIYQEIILWSRPPPSLGGEKFMVYNRNSGFKKIYEPQSTLRGEYGCAYSLEPTPTTCANFLACNRQINAEMHQAIERVRRKGQLNARLDCIAEDESFHYFTWLGVPLVSTTLSLQADGKRGMVLGWVKYLAVPLRLLSPALDVSECMTYRSSMTRISRLWIDVRIVGDRRNKWRRNSSAPDRTGWAVCAALKRLFDKGPHLYSEHDQPATRTLKVDELVLNVLPLGSESGATGTTPPTKFLDEDFPLDGVKEGLVHPKTVAKELVNVWNSIWAGDEFKGIFYGGLLEKIGWVRVCVNGETFRMRELSGVLERGRKERRRRGY